MDFVSTLTRAIGMPPPIAPAGQESAGILVRRRVISRVARGILPGGGVAKRSRHRLSRAPQSQHRTRRPADNVVGRGTEYL